MKKAHHIAKHARILRAVLFLGIAVVVCAIPAALVFPQQETKIYFYSCETNINNFKSLKMAWDRYFADLGPVVFQPFTEREAIEAHIKYQKHFLIIISSWHFKSISRQYALSPVLVGLQNGMKSQKRILVTTGDTSGRDTLTIGPIASASSLAHTRTVLAQMFDENVTARQLNILTVPKDIDALMSLGFGMSKSALTSRSGFDQLKQINPKLFNKMKIVKEGKASLSLILAVPRGFEVKSEHMVAMIRDMAKTPEGKEKISLIGLDGWQELDSSDHQNLEAK